MFFVSSENPLTFAYFHFFIVCIIFHSMYCFFEEEIVKSYYKNTILPALEELIFDPYVFTEKPIELICDYISTGLTLKECHVTIYYIFVVCFFN